MPEIQCLGCYRKHLGKANSLFDEWLEGKKGKEWLAMGEMDLATAHTIVKWPELALETRDARKNFEAQRLNPEVKYLPGLLALINKATELEKKDKTDGDSKKTPRGKRH
jgi:hypothetical protein